MKKIFLVKKDVNKPSGSDNWIVMNSYEFWNFKKTEDGKRRKKYFAPLNACTMDEFILYVECDEVKAKEIRKEKDKQKHLSKLEAESGYTTFSYSNLVIEGTDVSGEELLEDENCNVEEEVLQRLRYDELHKAVRLLPKSDQQLIYYLFFKVKPLSEAQYAEIIGESQQYINYQKKRALKRLKNILKN